MQKKELRGNRLSRRVPECGAPRSIWERLAIIDAPLPTQDQHYNVRAVSRTLRASRLTSAFEVLSTMFFTTSVLYTAAFLQ